MGNERLPLVVKQLALVATRNPNGPCEFTCLDKTCLPSWALVCNGHLDCPDESDEKDCPPSPSSTPVGQSLAGTQDVSTVQIIIIVISIVLTLGLITCIISHYKMGARSWSAGGRRHSPQPSGRQQPQTSPCPQQYQQQYSYAPTPPISSVLYSQATVQEQQRREALAQHDYQVRLQSVRMDLALNLPPSIALPDGEEHPYGSSKNLKLRDSEQESEIYRGCIKPPPNRTIVKGDKLPPFRSNSVGLLHKSNTPSTCLVRTSNGTPLVMRSHSMSSKSAQASKLSCPHSQFSSVPSHKSASHLRLQSPLIVGCNTSSSSNSSNGSTRTYGCARTPGSELDQTEAPPPYSDVVSSWNFGSIVNKQSNNGV